MKTTFTLQEILDNRGCYSEYEVKSAFNGKQTYDLIDDILLSDIPLKDKFWFLMRKTQLTLKQKQQIALECAKSVLDIFETKYPNDLRPRKAIEITERFINGIPISKEDLKDAAYAAYAAYAYAAYDVAYAAYAAAAAAAYNVAYSAAYTYAAAAAAYAPTAAKQRNLLDNVINLIKTINQ